MIRHMSLGVRNPEAVAAVLAELTGARAVRAPAPPFPFGSWFVVAGDDRGSSLEILPSTAVFDPQSPLGLRHRDAEPACSGAHVLIDSVHAAEQIFAVAAKQGWLAQEVETGMFRIVKLWIDEFILVEVLPAGESERYVENFGAAGLASLDTKLRQFETDLSDGFARKFTPSVIADALGAPGGG